jgi:glycosyltransferase involved in cell wall biosynthesis
MPARPCILWLHTQPEHYFNRMMDDLQARGEFDFVAAFSSKGPGHYTDYPAPRNVRTIFLTPREGQETSPKHFGRRHENWRKDLDGLQVDAAIVSGYGSRVHREVIFDCHRRGIPVAMWSDSNLRSQRGRGLKQRVKRRLKKRALSRLVSATDVMLTANSRGVAYWRYYGAAKNNIVLCPCYSDYQRIDDSRATPRQEALELLRIPAGDRYLFTAARLAPAKGLDLMIRAFLAGRYHQQGWHYCIAGTGPQEADLKALAGSELGRSIHILGFRQPRENLLFMAHADVFVLPSVYEPHGIVIPEAMAAGTPVLASDVCGAAFDLITPGVNGDYFKSENVEDLGRKLGTLINDPQRREAMRAEARRAFETWFAATSPIMVVHDTLHRMLKERRRR